MKRTYASLRCCRYSAAENLALASSRIALAMMLAVCAYPDTALAVAAAEVNYAQAGKPAIPPALIPLPPGAVQPAGWLRDWAVAAREGITGHLDEDHPVFAHGWKGTQFDGPFPYSVADGAGWSLEQCAYWLDGALRLGFVLHDEALLKKIRARLDPVVDGVLSADDWTSLIHWKKGYKPEGFNGWAHSHLGRALVALYQGTGDRKVLDALVKVYSEYPVEMGPSHFLDVSGLCNLDAMVETYALSGETKILDRVLEAVARPEVAKDFQAWGQGQLAPGHMVVLLEDVRLPALVYPWSGERRHLEATLGAVRWLDANHMLPYGVPSGEEHASGVGAFRKTETCDVAAMLLLTSWLYRVEGRGSWGDRMERAFFNAGAAPIARDFQSICYYQSPNRLRSDSLPCEQPLCPAGTSIRFHRLGCPAVLCCAGAVNRIVPNYIIHMWMATPDGGLAATLFGPCLVSARAGDNVAVTLTTTTDYPFGESIRIEVDPQEPVEFPLYVRIPDWCSSPRISAAGHAIEPTAGENGFVKIARRWSAGDAVEITLPMTPRLVRGFETAFPTSHRQYFGHMPEAVFQPRRLPYASILYGPLLFALPIPDLDPNTPVVNAKWEYAWNGGAWPGLMGAGRDAKWQYALDADPAEADQAIRVERKGMPARWNWPLDAPVALLAPARAFDWNPTDAQALPDGPVEGTASETIRLIPYGCTKFRISMFPVTPKVMGGHAEFD
jgi:hypothetical protein